MRSLPQAWTSPSAACGRAAPAVQCNVVPTTVQQPQRWSFVSGAHICMGAEVEPDLQAAPETGNAVEKNIRDSAKAVKEQAPKAAEQASQV